MSSFEGMAVLNIIMDDFEKDARSAVDWSKDAPGRGIQTRSL